MTQEVAPRIQIVQNDGTNSQEIVDEINGWLASAPIPNFVSVTDNAGTVEVRQMIFGSSVVTMSIPATGWAVLTGGATISSCTDAERVARYGAALATPTPVTQALGSATVPTILGSAQATIPVTLAANMGDADYAATAVLAGSASVLAVLSVVSATVVDSDTVGVVVENTGLISLGGATVLVAALHN